jgi:hypothetical protein
MSQAVRRVPDREAITCYSARIETHLGRLADGHDPPGHLFAIERLARAGRGEWLEERHVSSRYQGEQ